MSIVAQRILTSSHRLAMPVLTFPGASLVGTTVRGMVTDADAQAAAELALHSKYATPFLMSAMDLSVEAEEFGASIQMDDWEIPTVIGRYVTDMPGIEELRIPAIGTKRTAVYLKTIEKLRAAGTDAVVLGGMIGPFSLAGRLFGVSEALAETAGEPEMMHALLKKTTSYLSAYARAFKAAGAHGLIIAEPTAGLMSPSSTAEFSSPYVKQIREAVEDETFTIILHNCGARIGHLQASLDSGAKILHFGKPMDLPAALAQVPSDTILCGNLDPSEIFVGLTAGDVAVRTSALLAATASYKNFVISSGCDVPAGVPPANLEAFFSTVAR
ncbi:MAG: uroporphyrinogen decarboxylase family protein [Ignavibacteriae bacterium]|nr:uroporphyrinogen decarboxylase family protein [Ignavibacteriota bacterium]